MPSDLIPKNDDDFNKLQTQFVTAVVANPTGYGIPAADVTQMQTDATTWNAAYPTHVKAQEDAKTAAEKKNASRTKLEGDIRGAAKKINGTPGVDNALRVSAGLKAHAMTRTPAVLPATKPISRTAPATHYTIEIHVADETTPKRAAKPAGVRLCQLWMHVGDPQPADPTGYTFVRNLTRTPYLDVHPAADAGKTVYYLLRWENAKGDAGPWSDVLTAKVPL